MTIERLEITLADRERKRRRDERLARRRRSSEMKRRFAYEPIWFDHLRGKPR